MVYIKDVSRRLLCLGLHVLALELLVLKEDLSHLRVKHGGSLPKIKDYHLTESKTGSRYRFSGY